LAQVVLRQKATFVSKAIVIVKVTCCN